MMTIEQIIEALREKTHRRGGCGLCLTIQCGAWRPATRVQYRMRQSGNFQITSRGAKMADITHIFGGVYKLPEPTPDHIIAPEIQFIDAIRANGLEPPRVIHLDGKIHRFSASGKRGDDSGWYVGFLTAQRHPAHSEIGAPVRTLLSGPI